MRKDAFFKEGASYLVTSRKVFPAMKLGEIVYKKTAYLFFFFVVISSFFVVSGGSWALAAEAGKISWYGVSAHGKKTANGATFNRNDLTAAHRTLPFGTVVRVYLAHSPRQVLVEITDRGPFGKNRIVDVSLKAAHQLGIKKRGIALGTLEVVSTASGQPLTPQHAYFVRLSDSLPAQKAHQLSYVLEMALHMDVRAFFSAQNPKPGFVLCVGPYETFADARKAFVSLSEFTTTADIIEAPRAGGDLPLHVPPQVGYTKGTSKFQDGKNKKENSHTGKRALAKKKSKPKVASSRQKTAKQAGKK